MLSGMFGVVHVLEWQGLPVFHQISRPGESKWNSIIFHALMEVTSSKT